MKSQKEILWDNHISLEKLQRDKPTFAMNILNAMHDYAMQQVKKLNVPAVSNSEASVCVHPFENVYIMGDICYCTLCGYDFSKQTDC